MPHCCYRCLAGAAEAGENPATQLPSQFRLSLVLFNRTANQNPRRAAQRANLQRKATLCRPPEIPNSSHKVNCDKQMKCLKTATGPRVAGVPWAIPHRLTTLWAMPRERILKILFYDSSALRNTKPLPTLKWTLSPSGCMHFLSLTPDRLKFSQWLSSGATRLRSTDRTPQREIRNTFPYWKEDTHININMKPEDPVFIYNPLERDRFYGSRKCEVFFFPPKELLV